MCLGSVSSSPTHEQSAECDSAAAAAGPGVAAAVAGADPGPARRAREREEQGLHHGQDRGLHGAPRQPGLEPGRAALTSK